MRRARAYESFCSPVVLVHMSIHFVATRCTAVENRKKKH